MLNPDAHLDPDKLQEAVRRADFTPTGVNVWLRGTVSDDGQMPDGASRLWLVTPGSGQRFRLVADDDTSRMALESLEAAPQGSVIVHGTALAGEFSSQVTIHVQGMGEAE